MVPGPKPIWIASDRREQRMQTVGWGKQRLKKFSIHVNHNSIDIKTFTDKMVLIHSTKKTIDHSFLHRC